jgi:hypothetical protein
MSSQLDILALEPFYGGVRKSMLETVIRCSRHRWTLLKLPPRRIERRLSAAAQWFAEQLSRHWAGRVDLLFTSEALNLADLIRLVPELEDKPSVVYFHNNQLPDPEVGETRSTTDLVNLNTAQAAMELWFNSEFHINLFAYRAAGCWPVVPEDGVYPEIIPKRFRKSCLYDATPDALASRVQDAWHLHSNEDGAEGAFLESISGYDAITACKAMDERLSVLATKRSANG